MTFPLAQDDSFSFDTQLLLNFENESRYYVCLLSRNINLRPWSRSRLRNIGIDRYKAKKPSWNVLLFSLVRFVPEVLQVTFLPGYRIRIESQFAYFIFQIVNVRASSTNMILLYCHIILSKSVSVYIRALSGMDFPYSH